jgi:hypothetical protein
MERVVAAQLVLLCGCHASISDPGAPDPGDPPADCTSIATDGAPVPMRRLTASQVERTVRDVLGARLDGAAGEVAVTDEKLFTYRSNISSPVDTTGARGYLDFAESTARSVDLSRCALPSETAECTAWLFDEVALRLFRRPLDDMERDRYAMLYEAGAATGTGADGASWVIEAMLQSPSFLYLDEVVEADGYLDDYSVASRLSLVLWGQNPDLALLERAGRGELSTPDALREEAMRLLADPRSEGGLSDFVDQWFELHRLDDPDTRPDLAALGPETIAALRTEPVALFRSLLLDGGGLPDLLTTSETAALDELTRLYGEDIVSRSIDSVTLDPARRAGIMSLPGVMAALAHAERTSPTLRGHAVLANLLCTPPPPPPAGVSVTLPEVGPDVTTRERLELHFSDPTCASCHRGMDGMGFAFESFDWLGRFRDHENGHPIEDTSTFTLGEEEVTVDGPVDLAHTMATNPGIAICVARQWTSFASGVPTPRAADCLVERLASDVSGDDGLRAMILTYLTSDWFRRGSGAMP